MNLSISRSVSDKLKMVLLSSVVFTAINARADDSADIKDYVKCAQSIRRMELLAGGSKPGWKGAVYLRAKRDKQEGVYVYVGDSAFFYPFKNPKTPKDNKARVNYYYFKVKVPGENTIYFNFNVPMMPNPNPDASESLGIAWENSPTKGPESNYQWGQSLNDDPQARLALAAHLAEEIKGVAKSYENENSSEYERCKGKSAALRQGNCGTAHMSNPQPYIDQLDACRLQGNKDVRAAAVSAQQDLVQLQKNGPLPVGSEPLGRIAR